MKNRFTFLDEETKIPDVVNEKCALVYEQIREEAQTQPSRKNIRHSKCFTAICIAAAAAVICSIPVSAAIYHNTNGFSAISRTYTKDPAERLDLSPYAVNVNSVSEESMAAITLQSVYCDGDNIAASFMLEPNTDKFKGMTGITGIFIPRLNGKKLDRYDSSEPDEINFVKCDDGNFYGTWNISDCKVTGESELTFDIRSLKGFNGNKLTFVPDNPGSDNWFASGCYEPEMTELYAADYSFSTKIKPDTSNNRTYEINETKEGVTLRSAAITPFRTVFDISGNMDGRSLRLVDQNGDEIDPSQDSDGTINFSTPYKTSKTLTLEVLDLDQDDFPAICGFTFDIEKGFADKYDVAYDNSDVVYDPPMEELDRLIAEYNNSKADKFAETVDLSKARNISEISVDEHCDFGEYDGIFDINTKIKECRIADVEDYDVRTQYAIYGTVSGEGVISYDPEKTKLLLITYEIENTSDNNGFWYASPLSVITGDLKYDTYCGDVCYQEEKDHGGKSGYCYDLAPHEKRTITIGCAIPAGYDLDDLYTFTGTDYEGNIYFVSAVDDVIHNLGSFRDYEVYRLG